MMGVDCGRYRGDCTVISFYFISNNSSYNLNYLVSSLLV